LQDHIQKDSDTQSLKGEKLCIGRRVKSFLSF